MLRCLCFLIATINSFIVLQGYEIDILKGKDKCNFFIRVCENINCPYGKETRYNSDSCPICFCINPCITAVCEPGTHCVIEEDKDDTDRYVGICQETHKSGANISDLSFHTKIPVSFLEGKYERRRIVAEERSNVTLSCSVAGCPPPRITWTYNNTAIVNGVNGSNDKFHINSSGDLYISEINTADAGTYICTAENGIDPSLTHNIELQVQGFKIEVLKGKDKCNFFNLVCENINCPYGKETQYNSDSCPICFCKNPCITMNCSPESSCVVESSKNQSDFIAFIGVCRQTANNSPEDPEEISTSDIYTTPTVVSNQELFEEDHYNWQKVCSLEKGSGSCANYTIKYFYDVVFGGCSRFWYGDCGDTDLGYGNRFNSAEECKKICVEPEGRAVCFLPMSVGPCTAYMPHWFYDYENKTCTQFIYQGCLGNNNRFETEEECKNTCVKK
ncbi:hypothetical protein DMENIID0001_093630 [Sergentomyia squamirostris]